MDVFPLGEHALILDERLGLLVWLKLILTGAVFGHRLAHALLL